MVASESFQGYLRDQLAPLGPLSMRRMFGKTGVFCEGVMLGMVTEDALYLRVDDGNRREFAEASVAPPLNYEKGGRLIDLSFWLTPDRVLDDPEELLRWARKALGAAHRVAGQRPPRARRKPAAAS